MNTEFNWSLKCKSSRKGIEKFTDTSHGHKIRHLVRNRLRFNIGTESIESRPGNDTDKKGSEEGTIVLRENITSTSSAARLCIQSILIQKKKS